MEHYDAIIVGAGPAGLSAAKTLAERGHKTSCLDKKQEIGNPIRCAEGLGLGWFERLNIKPDPRWVCTEMYGAALYSPSGKKIEFRTDKVSGYILDRKTFEKHLAYEAANAGAKIKTKSHVTNAERKEGKVTLTVKELDNEYQVSADIIVAADGVETTIPRLLGLNTTNKLNDIDSGFQYEMSGIDYEHPELINLFFGTEVAPRGYCWIFPKGPHEGNVGIGISGANPKTAKAYLDEFIAKHPGLAKGSVVEVNAGGVPVGGFLDTMVADNLVVCGDSAHQVNPIHGGGIGIAIEGARLAAEAASDALKKGDVSAAALEPYNKKWYEQRGNRLKQVLKRRHMLEVMTDEDFETLASSLSGEDVKKIAEGDLGESVKIIGKKLISTPALMKVMLKYLQ